MTQSPDTSKAAEPGRSPHPAVAEFAERLRQLRTEAGSPSFRKLARLTHYSSSTCADATAGHRLPTEAVVKAFVMACGTDPAEWLELHRKAVAAIEAPPPRPVAAPVGAGEGEREGAGAGDRQRKPSAIAVAIVVSTLIAGIGIGAGAAVLMHTGGSSANGPEPVFTLTPHPAPSYGVGDGADPDKVGCFKDHKLVDKSALMLHGEQIGALELLYSPTCQAGWARVYLYPGQPIMLGSVTVFSDDQRSSEIAYPLIKQVPDYTNVVVPAQGGCLGATGTVFKTGERPVTATIKCQAPVSS